MMISPSGTPTGRMHHFSSAPLERRRSSMDRIILDLHGSFEFDYDAAAFDKVDVGMDLGDIFLDDKAVEPANTRQEPTRPKPCHPQEPQAHETDSPLTLLHRVCQAFPTNKAVIETALLLDEEGAARPADLPVLAACSKATDSDGRNWWKNAPDTKQKKTQKDFSYPINIAINNGASTEVIQLLAKAAPHVLLKSDGSQGLTSPQIALLKQPKNHKLIQVLLKANSMAAFVQTKHQDTLLHMACQNGCPLSIVKTLNKAHLGAQKQTNFHGDTPKEIARRTLRCPEDVVDFLQGRQ